jgi:hypothetical protein
MPEWQGVGIGLAFLECLAGEWLAGRNRYHRPMPTILNTSHPGLCRALRRSRRWVQCSSSLYGCNRTRSRASLTRCAIRAGGWSGSGTDVTGYGGHFRAIQGFKFLG